ncbi:MAG: adenylate/guanylate cyclase domain-containing protein [Pseudomonadota bacterium]|mgnify:CR=1 FL=1
MTNIGLTSYPFVRPASQARRLGFGIIILLFLCLVTAPFYVNLVARDTPDVTQGVISFKNMDALSRPVELKGNWAFIWRSGAGNKASNTSKPAFIRVPGKWSDDRAQNEGGFPAQGLGSYRLLIKGLHPGGYRLYVPVGYNATQVSINGAIVSRHGTLGQNAATTSYEARSHEVFFSADGRDITLAIDIVAFLHRDNGLETPPVLGPPLTMQYWTALQWGQEFLFHTTLVLLGTFGLGVFLFRRSDKPSLYLAISSFLFLVPSAIQGFDNIFLMAFPGFSFGQMLAAHYISTTLSLGFFLAYAHALFPNESPERAYRIMLSIFAVQAAIQCAGFLIGGTLLASRVNIGLMFVMQLVFLYIFVVLVRAVRNNRDGAMIFLLGMAVFFLSITMLAVVAYGIMPSDKLIGYDLTGYGILILLFSHIIVLAERWSAAIYEAEQMNDDLRQLLDVNLAITSEMQLESLLRKIVGVTTKLLHADRSSLFLYDGKRNELWSVVAEGVNSHQIRFSADQGLAGHALMNGEVINTSDAYDDPRFIHAMDVETGYRSRSVLSMPILARDGRKLGVMQALNRQNATRFSSEDISKMGAFAAQAAIAIDNATLFSQIVESRNYNEGILRSMSAGVITLDREGQVIKVNDAAASMFGVSAEIAQTTDLRAFLTSNNPQSIVEIDEVRDSGESKTFLDIDLTTLTGGTLSANVSIVPLINDGERQGVLILIEDITQGKRLEGAMRRFMTQNVVDQVLGHENDLLFGAACEASVMFADIRNFTAMAEQLSPREAVDMLNEIFTELFESVAAFDGMLDKFIGDALMAVYGAPISGTHDAANAVASAIQMQSLIAGINARRREDALEDIRLGIGIASGEVIAGTIGSPKRMDYTVIGDSVNLAARLENSTKYYHTDIIICEKTAAGLSSNILTRELDLIRVRGRQTPSKIYQILPRQDGDLTLQTALVATYDVGRKHLAKREWAKAVKAFTDALAIAPDDHPSAIMLERAKILLETPNPDWDGVWHSRRGLVRGCFE